MFYVGGDQPLLRLPLKQISSPLSKIDNPAQADFDGWRSEWH
jgi:hypothetical protein